MLVGYTPDAAVSSPVMAMVSNERQVLGSRSSTRAELVVTSELLARGDLEAVVDRIYPLNAINEALTDLVEGVLVGRGVIDLSIGR